MIVNFTNVDFDERPVLILKNAGDTPLGVLGYAHDITLDLKYNETSSIEFSVPEIVDGVKTPLYNEICGMRIVELMGIGQFTLISPSESGDGVHRAKTCKGYSLEYEFAYKKLSLPKSTYKFWDEVSREDTLLGIILDSMPSWSIGEVALDVQNKYRTFEVNNENLYNLIKGTVQESYNCIFDFDTMTRRIYVRNASDEPINKPVFISLDNLAKEIEVTENTEDIVTRLDVSGAENVNIRDVNPTGTNKIINLDYYMTETNFPAELIDKYNAWKQACEENRRPYYNLSVQYSLLTAQRIAETANLTDLQNEKIKFEGLQAVAVQSAAQGVSGTQAELDQANANIAQKQIEIEAKEAEIAALQEELNSVFGQLTAITSACRFEDAFTENELVLLDRYIKDGEIQESGFVATEVQSFGDAGKGTSFPTLSVEFSDGSIEHIETAAGGNIYDLKGGKLTVGDDMTANVVSGVMELRPKGNIVITAHLSTGTISGNAFPSACVTITGESGTLTPNSTSITSTLNTCYRYFTLNASEYEKRSVAWELYEYGEEALNKLCVPTYSFSVTSANFLALNEFVTFRDALTLGEKVYIDLGERGVLRPILTGVNYAYDDMTNMTLQFSDSYHSTDSTFRLVDLLEQSISAGKNVEMSKYIYSAFVDSGASTGLREFMMSALDVTKNAIISSNEQAISWDGAGFRLRKWRNIGHTSYDPEQIWMINNSIVMTDNNWETAQMAIGKFHDENLGDCWGIVAPRLVGTLIAGGSLIIESAKRDGGTATFRVDGEGCRLYNSDISVCNSAAEIGLNPEVGLIIGKYPLYNIDEETGVKTPNEDNVKFWADSDGNLHLKGTLHGVDGDFEGSVRATSLTIEGEPSGQYVEARTEPICNGERGIAFVNSEQTPCVVDALTLNRNVGLKIEGTYGDDKAYFQVKNGSMGFYKEQSDGDKAMLYYENGGLTLDGKIKTKSGAIGGWDINATQISTGTSSAPSEINAEMGMRTNDSNWGFWAGSGTFKVKPNGELYSTNATISGKITAKSGKIGGFEITENYLFTGGMYGAANNTTSTGISGKSGNNAFWAGNGQFKVTQQGKLTARNAEITGTLKAGSWTFDSNGSKYENGSDEVTMSVSDGWAKYSTNSLSAEYGSTNYEQTKIHGGTVCIQCAEVNGGESVTFKSSKSTKYVYNDVCVVCDQAGGGTWDGAHGNIGTTDQRWDVGWFKALHYSTLHSNSSRTIKHDIHDMKDMGDILDALTPVTYVYNNDKDDKLRYGLIYEDTVNILPEICSDMPGKGASGYSLNYLELVPILLKEIQGLRKRVAALERA